MACDLTAVAAELRRSAYEILLSRTSAYHCLRCAGTHRPTVQRSFLKTRRTPARKACSQRYLSAFCLSCWNSSSLIVPASCSRFAVSISVAADGPPA